MIVTFSDRKSGADQGSCYCNFMAIEILTL